MTTAEPAPTTPDEVTPLPKLVVQGNAVCSYGIGVIAKWNNQTQQLTSVTIDDVSPSSAAEKNGLKRGDEIISINSRKITDLKGGMKPGSDLSDLLVNQLNGRVIYLEVAVRTKAGAHRVAPQPDRVQPAARASTPSLTRTFHTQNDTCRQSVYWSRRDPAAVCERTTARSPWLHEISPGAGAGWTDSARGRSGFTPDRRG